MQVPTLELTEARRAGLLAAVTVYPVSRLAGTLPRPALDRAVVSGATMAVAFASASATTGLLRRAVARESSTELARDARTAVATGGVALASGVIAARVRGRARREARHGRRLSRSTGAIGSTAEVLAIAAAAGAAISGADVVGARLPDWAKPRHPVAVVAGIVVAGAALAAVSRHRRVLAFFSLPTPEGSPESDVSFQTGASLPVAAARAGGVAVLTLAALTVETRGAHALARLIDGADHPDALAIVAGHAVIAAGTAAVGLAGFAFYSSRVAVQERLLEAAYAAVPSRRGVSGGPDSIYEFSDLGREGRRFVSQAYTADELSSVLGVRAEPPVRVFVPLQALSGDAESDAELIVAEVERLGGFTTSTLVLAAPTGDGYVSYVQTETVELLTAGDCTTIAVPYAAVPSAVAFPRRHAAAAAFAVYARAVATRARQVNPTARLFVFGESLGSIVALDAFGPDVASRLHELGFDGGLYVGVPIFSVTDRALRPHHPEGWESHGVQYVPGRDRALAAAPGHVNLSHPTDPVALADPSTLVRHPVDYWGRPTGTHVPLVSFLVELADVKNAMNLRPGEFLPSLGHDYRYDTAAAVARAYGLSFHQEELIEDALRERELAWSVRRLLSRRLGEARDAALAQLQSWGVDPATLSTRFAAQREALSTWFDKLGPDGDAGGDTREIAA